MLNTIKMDKQKRTPVSFIVFHFILFIFILNIFLFYLFTGFYLFIYLFTYLFIHLFISIFCLFIHLFIPYFQDNRLCIMIKHNYGIGFCKVNLNHGT